MKRGLPSGVQMQASVRIGGGAEYRMRLLGDEQRGYLLVGQPPGSTGEEFWFHSLNDALTYGRRFGVSADQWTAISDGYEI